MNYRRFGKTELMVSETGFGAWAIGGPAQVGNIAIGWGASDDNESCQALLTAFGQGINFYDTADFYGLGHSEELIGKVFANNQQVIIATKVGQKPGTDRPVDIDYSRQYILQACEASLRRLKREQVDYYQLHVANIEHLKQGECVEAMQMLKAQGKIRYWGISLSTYNPFPEAQYMMENELGDGFQLAFNIINQVPLPLFHQMQEKGYGIIARMPLQFGLLAGKFSASTLFDESDHRRVRLTPEIIAAANSALQEIWLLAEKYQISKAQLAIAFTLSFPGVSTTIPGIRTPRQALLNSQPAVQLQQEDINFIISQYHSLLEPLLKKMQLQG